MVHTLPTYGIVLARGLLALIFLLNALGLIDQSQPAQEMIARGVPAPIVPLLMWSGRTLQFVAVWLFCVVSGNAWLRSPSSYSSCQPP